MVLGLDDSLTSFLWSNTIKECIFTHMHELQKEISDRIEQSNPNYKLRADIRKKFKIFNVGDFVIVQIHP